MGKGKRILISLPSYQSAMDIIKSLEWRYATKNFNSDRTVPEDKIELLVQSFNLTATSYGLQPIKLVIVKNKELQKKMVPASYGQQQVSDASHVFVICIEKVVDSSFINRYFDHVKVVRNTPDDILQPFRQQLISSFGDKSPEEIEQWAKNQAYLALGNLLATCALEKIDSCPMEGFIPEQYDELLQLSSLGLQSVLALPIGYRASDDFFADLKKVRRSVNDTVIFKSNS